MTRSNKAIAIAIASAVASLLATGALAADKAPQKSGKDAAAKVNCGGVNECKAKGECGGPGHDCAGMNDCKGKGWVSLSEKDCKAKGGKVIAMNP